MRYDQRRSAKFVVCAALVAVFALHSSLLAEEKPSLVKAQKLVGDQKVVIARFMHPTSVLGKVDYLTAKTSETGDFYLVYSFWFDSEKYHSSLRFKFFEDGSLDVIEVAGTTTWIKPFQAADLLFKALFHMIPLSYTNVIADLQLEGTAKMALEWWLRARQKP